MGTAELSGSLKRSNGLSIAAAILMIAVGILAIALPLAAGIGVSIFVSWLIFCTGFAHLAYAFAARGAGGFVWRLMLGIVYIAGGLYLAFHPGLSLLSFTLVLAFILYLEGFMQILAYFSLRALPGAGWILLDGIVTLLLGLMIGFNWPSASAWAIGTIVGINFLFSGVTRLAHAGAPGKALAELSGDSSNFLVRKFPQTGPGTQPRLRLGFGLWGRGKVRAGLSACGCVPLGRGRCARTGSMQAFEPLPRRETKHAGVFDSYSAVGDFLGDNRVVPDRHADDDCRLLSIVEGTAGGSGCARRDASKQELPGIRQRKRQLHQPGSSGDPALAAKTRRCGAAARSRSRWER